jgi:hypothetical protein
MQQENDKQGSSNKQNLLQTSSDSQDGLFY